MCTAVHSEKAGELGYDSAEVPRAHEGPDKVILPDLSEAGEREHRLHGRSDVIVVRVR